MLIEMIIFYQFLKTTTAFVLYEQFKHEFICLDFLIVVVIFICIWVIHVWQLLGQLKLGCEATYNEKTNAFQWDIHSTNRRKEVN